MLGVKYSFLNSFQCKIFLFTTYKYKFSISFRSYFQYCTLEKYPLDHFKLFIFTHSSSSFGNNLLRHIQIRLSNSPTDSRGRTWIWGLRTRHWEVNSNNTASSKAPPTNKAFGREVSAEQSRLLNIWCHFWAPAWCFWCTENCLAARDAVFFLH